MKIKRLIGGNLESNGFVIYDREGGECYIIDPGYLPERFVKLVREWNLTPKGILLTHHHYDHSGGVEKLSQLLDIPVYLHRGDLDQYKKSVDHVLEGGESLLLGEEVIQVIHTPGHTRGGVCFYSEKSKLAFTGDTIFNVDLGRTDLVDGSPEVMADTIRNIISLWSNEITIYPGHGDQATMRWVRKNNQEFLDLLV